MSISDPPPINRVDRLRAEVEASRAEASVLSGSFDESTGLSWLWAFLFGPIYFAVHGFWGRAVVVLALNFLVIGFIVAPFLAYPAWRERANRQAEKMLLLDRLRQGR
ncbi:DUF2628 domain-containing protein [Paracoccus sp. TOH]|uniref:DUF2628 domain-containing protein n=1 Tax=Paracoccus simplex TaxID=2086346 RepID=A0ABV7S306_9RHOB|nr:DUF2628 domain-containing protein [Paracoccus sp. TOH]WJS84699.1 DUF2628 domain-containing protein [Paracoccus sp. TOH]